MPSKRFLSTTAPLAILALAGMGLATAQSSSPFSSKNRAQAWEQQPAVPARKPQAWEVPAYEPPNAVQKASSAAYDIPAPTSFEAPARVPTPYTAPASADSPIAVRPRPAPLPSYSSTTPPKTFGGQPVLPAPQNQGYAPQGALAGALAGSPTSPPAAPRSIPNSAPPVGSNYGYTPAPAKTYAQAPDFGSPTPPQPPTPAPTSAPPISGSPFAPQPAPVGNTGSSTGGSPFAPRSGGRVQAWEQPQTTYQAPAPQTPTYQQPQYQQPQGAPSQQYQGQQYQGQPQYQGAPQTPPNGYAPQNGYVPGYQSPVPPTGAPSPGGPFAPQQPQKPRSWSERLGLNNLATILKGKLNLGAAATFRDQPEGQLGPNDGFNGNEIIDAELEFEVSAITQGGLEYGIALGARAQYDPFRRGFGGRLPDCPPGTDGCSGATTGLRGHTSGFYSIGEDIARDAQGNLETAHVFLRSAYGDVTIGRDDGAAYLFSLGAPTLLAVGASNSPVDYTGFDSVKTVNDASGFARKITYTTPRLLGDQIGVGVQLGASYAPNTDVCGVDYCNGRNIDDVLQPDIEDVFEVGLALDRTFQNGLRAELTGTYATGSENSNAVGLDNLQSYGAGIEFEYADWTLGGSFLQSNNGLDDGDYTAFDAGLTWKPSALGFTLGYGYAEDENVGLTSNQGTFGVTYEFDKFTIGTGVQYVDREVNGIELGLPTTLDQKATSVFIQGGFKF